MKPPLFRRLSDETVVEVKLPCHILIDRLQNLQGGSSETDCVGGRLLFFCSKKGCFSVESWSGRRSVNNLYRPYYIAGEVLTENDKTVVRFYTVHRRFSRVKFFVAAIVLALLMVLYAFVTIPSKSLFVPLAIGIVGAAVSTIILSSSFRKIEKNGVADIEKMKQEVLNRLEAAKRWED